MGDTYLGIERVGEGYVLSVRKEQYIYLDIESALMGIMELLEVDACEAYTYLSYRRAREAQDKAADLVASLMAKADTEEILEPVYERMKEMGWKEPKKED